MCLCCYQFLFFLYAVPPNITTPRTIFGSYVESDVTAECIIEAFPVPVNYWTKGTKSLITYDSGGIHLNQVASDSSKSGSSRSNKDEILSLR